MFRMRKRYRVLVLAAIVAAVVVPVGFALSLESSQAARVSSTTVARTGVATPAVASTAASTSAAAVASPVVIGGTTTDKNASPMIHPLTDAAKLLLVGTMLFGLAAAVRKAS